MRSLLLLLLLTSCGRLGYDPLDSTLDDADVDVDASQGMDADPAIDGATPLQTLFVTDAINLYSVAPANLSQALVAPLEESSLPIDIGELAIDGSGQMWGTDNSGTPALFRIDRQSGAAVRVGPLTMAAPVRGLTFVPPGVVGPNEELLVTYQTELFQVDTQSGGLTPIGVLIGGDVYGGDITFLPGTGLVATLEGGSSSDEVAVIDPATGQSISSVVINVNVVLGLGVAGDRLFGAARGGELIEIDPTTGSLLQLVASPREWFGAAP